LNQIQLYEQKQADKKQYLLQWRPPGGGVSPDFPQYGHFILRFLIKFVSLRKGLVLQQILFCCHIKRLTEWFAAFQKTSETLTSQRSVI